MGDLTLLPCVTLLPCGRLSYVVLVQKDGIRIYQGKATLPEWVTRFDIRL